MVSNPNIFIEELHIFSTVTVNARHFVTCGKYQFAPTLISCFDIVLQCISRILPAWRCRVEVIGFIASWLLPASQIEQVSHFFSIFYSAHIRSYNQQSNRNDLLLMREVGAL